MVGQQSHNVTIGNQAQRGRRSFMLYDRLGRDVVTGTCRDALSDDFWLPSAPDMPASSFDCTGDAVSDLGALSTANPQQYAEARLLTATYYDDYNFLTAAQQSRLAAMRPAGALTAPKGLPTGTLTAVLGPDGIPTDSIAPMLTVNWYDAEERVIATAAISHRGDLLSVATSYTRGGLPVDVATTLREGASGAPVAAAHSLNYGTDYDSHGRIIATRLSRGGAVPVTLAANSYDRLGRLQRTEYHGGLWRNSDYDMHGWLTGWHCGFLGQQLLYAAGATPSYTGRVSAKITDSYGHYDRYYYTYDRLGRLAAADFSRRMPSGATAENGDPEADFSTAYTYDLQGNMLSLTRQGLIAPGLYGTVDDITASFSGNRLSELRDDAPTVLLEASLDLPEGAWSGSDFAYDANGNQTRDMSRGVSDVTYNVLNLPQRVEFADGGRIDYLYSASGTKLAETVYDASGSLLSRRDYVGQFEFVADTLERTLLPEGFVTAGDNVFHAYIPDYQGNIVGVYNSSTNTLEQFTDYYPYGLPHASATSPTVNRRKYGAKELTTANGLNLYDFAARWHNPTFPAFTTVDPMATDYYPASPYLYCGADPINLVDLTGENAMKIINLTEKTIVVKATYYVVTQPNDANQISYDEKDIEWMSTITEYLNDLNMMIPSGEYEGFTISFDLTFEAGGTDKQAKETAKKDVESGICIGNVIKLATAEDYPPFAVSYDSAGGISGIGGTTGINYYIRMNYDLNNHLFKSDYKMNIIHEIFHTFGFSHPPGGSKKGIMHYPPLKPNASDALEIINNPFMKTIFK